MTTDQDDLFDDQPAPQTAASGASEGQNTAPGGEADQGSGESGETGENNGSAAPPAEGNEGTEAGKPEKMIPESRLRAAIADVQGKLEAANQKLAQYEAAPVPDKDTDPDGYNLHVRMEASKTVMRDLVPDYDTVILHYKEMADANPFLNEQVAAHPIPAKFAYDLAKRDLEIKEALDVRGSDDWKQFQEWKKSRTTQQQQQTDPQVSKAGQQVANNLAAGAVPNLNRATNTAPKGGQKVEDDDYLFKDAKF